MKWITVEAGGEVEGQRSLSPLPHTRQRPCALSISSFPSIPFQTMSATQADFDEAVRVNMADFGMGPEEAVASAVEELTMQARETKKGGGGSASGDCFFLRTARPCAR